MAGEVRATLQIVGTVVGAYFGYPYLGSLIGECWGGSIDPLAVERARELKAAEQGGPL